MSERMPSDAPATVCDDPGDLSECRGQAAGSPGEHRRRTVKVPAFHSKAPNDRKVHHNDTKCTEGNNIETYNKVSGTGGYPLCSHCARL